MTKEKFKNEVKDWWTENKGKIVVGAKCLAAGLGIGFIRGAVVMAHVNADMINTLIDNTSSEPDIEDIYEWVKTHPDDVREIQEDLKS